MPSSDPPRPRGGAEVKPFKAWIAVSAQGHPAPFLGYAFTRSELKRKYVEQFTSDFDVAGYRAVRVFIVAAHVKDKKP
jgi:hypothetical protein